MRGKDSPQGRCRLLARLERARDDGGFTLVEILVALVIIVIVLVPFGVLFLNTLNASSSNASRQNASVVAASVLSNLDATTYSNVGFTTAAVVSAIAADPSYATAAVVNGKTVYTWTPNVDGDTSSEQLMTVTTAPSFSVDSVAFAPIMTNVVSGHTHFTVYTHIVQQTGKLLACNGGTTSVTGAYLRAFVEVDWSNGTISNEKLYQDKLIYPGGMNPTAAQSSPPATPSITSATPQSVSGEVIIKWALPSSWTSSTSCFKVGWSDVNQNQDSSGFLTTTTGSTCPSVVGNAPPTVFTVSSGVASYCATGLTQGGSGQAYTFYVTAYSPDATVSSESGELAANSPQGPTISDVSDTVTSGGGPSGKAGDSITLTGKGFATSSQVIEFCSTAVPCTSSFSPGCSTATLYCQTVNCTSATSCTITAPTLSAAATSGVYYVIAETTTTPYVTSAPQASSSFTYIPKITGATVQPSGGTTTVTGTNLFQYNTAFDFGSQGATNVSCSAGGTSCTMTVPNDSSGLPILAGTGQLTAVNNGVVSNAFTYTY